MAPVLGNPPPQQASSGTNDQMVEEEEEWVDRPDVEGDMFSVPEITADANDAEDDVQDVVVESPQLGGPRGEELEEADARAEDEAEMGSEEEEPESEEEEADSDFEIEIIDEHHKLVREEELEGSDYAEEADDFAGDLPSQGGAVGGQEDQGEEEDPIVVVPVAEPEGHTIDPQHEGFMFWAGWLAQKYRYVVETYR